MKKFIKKTIIITLSIYTPWLFFVHAGRFYHAPIDYQAWEFKHDLLGKKTTDFDPEEIIVGDSLSVAAIDPTLVSASLYNLAMSGSNPVDSYFYLKKYLLSGRRPKRVFLSFGITHWQGSDTFRGHSLGFGFMSYNEFFGISERVKRGNPFL